MKIILASQSPRRKELLGRLVSDFAIQPADIDETPKLMEEPIAYVQRMAAEKAAAVQKENHGALVIASDTTVVLGKEIFGKPVDAEDAKRMLRQFSGKTHDVFTAVVLSDGKKEERILSHAAVTFYELTDEEIERYLATGDHSDKAGAYGIQSFAGAFVESIAGDYYSIVGFPIGAVNQALKKWHDVLK